jgi:hypothetical protein
MIRNYVFGAIAILALVLSVFNTFKIDTWEKFYADGDFEKSVTFILDKIIKESQPN